MNGAEAKKIDERHVPGLDAAKVVIKDYFEQHDGEVIDYVDLPLPLVVEACEQLEREGKIAGVD